MHCSNRYAFEKEMQWVYRVARQNGYKKDEVDRIKKKKVLKYNTGEERLVKPPPP